MKNKVLINENCLVIKLSPLSKVFALHGDIVIPLTHVKGATVDESFTDSFQGLRRLGTHEPLTGYLAGTFIKDEDKTFFNVSRRDTPLVIQLKNEDFDRLVLGIAESEQIADEINNAIE